MSEVDPAHLEELEKAVNGTRLDNDSAQDESNMLRVQMGQDIRTGEVPMRTSVDKKKSHEQRFVEHLREEYSFEIPESLLGRKPTPEDYDLALKAVEEIQQLAADEPKVVEFFYNYAKKINIGFEFVILLLSIAPSLLKGLKTGQIPQSNESEVTTLSEMSDRYELSILKFNSAKEILSRLKERAERFGEQSASRNRVTNVDQK